MSSSIFLARLEQDLLFTINDAEAMAFKKTTTPKYLRKTVPSGPQFGAQMEHGGTSNSLHHTSTVSNTYITLNMSLDRPLIYIVCFIIHHAEPISRFPRGWDVLLMA